jgi:hypothetical protein
LSESRTHSGDLQARERKWYLSRDEREQYLKAAQHWKLSVEALNDITQLLPEDHAILEIAFEDTQVPNATWWHPEPRDGQHYFTLPSLNDPGSQVTLRGGPFPPYSDPRLQERGLLTGMQRVPLALNCAPEVISAINSFVKSFRRGDGQSGLVFSGCTMVRNSNRIEGRFLAIAGRLSHVNLVVRVLLVGEIASLLASDQPEKLLEPGYLLIPDLQMWSRVFGSDRPITYRLVELLKERERKRLPTIVYAEDRPGLEPGLASLLQYRYRRVDLAKVGPVHDLSDQL